MSPYEGTSAPQRLILRAVVAKYGGNPHYFAPRKEPAAHWRSSMRKAGQKSSGLKIWVVDRAREARPTAPPPSERVGEFLRRCREERGWTLEQVGRALRIGVDKLEAIESSRFAALPGKAYIVGFARAYARLLELDVAAVLARLRTEMTHVPDQHELVFPEPPSERRIPAGALVSLSVCALIGVYIVWYYQTAQHHVRREVVLTTPVQPVEPVPPPPDIAVAAALSANNAPVTLTTPPMIQPPPMAIAPAVNPQPATVSPPPGPAETAPTATPAGPTPSASQSVAAVPRPAAPEAAVTAAVPAPVSRGAAPAQAAEVPGINWMQPSGQQGGIVLKAAEPTWIEVRSVTGEVLYNKLMKPGDSYTVPARTDLKLTTGNAGGLDIVVGSETVPRLGKSGAVVRDIVLDGSRLLAGTATARN